MKDETVLQKLIDQDFNPYTWGLGPQSLLIKTV